MAQQRRKNIFGDVDSLTDLRVGTYNIFLTTDKALAENFANYNSFSLLKQDMEREVAKANRQYLYGDIEEYQRKSAGKKSLVLLSSDVNLLEFTHEYNFGDSNSGAPIIKLTTFEPGLEILKKFYYLFLGEKISEIKYRKSELETLSKKLDSAADRDQLEGIRLPDTGELVIGSELKDIAESRVKQDIRNNIRGQRVFIAYGVGDDLRYWSGCYSNILGRLEYGNDGKKETVTYHFTPDHIGRQFDELPNTNSDFLEEMMNATIPIMAYRDTPKAAADLYFRFGAKGYTREILDFPGFTPSLHDNIVKLISHYLYGLGIKNHLIVLPNLDYLLAPVIASTLGSSAWLKQLQERFAREGEDETTLLSTENLLQSIVYQNQRIFGLQTGRYDLGGGVAGGDHLYKLTMEELVQLQKDVLFKIGLRGSGREREGSEVDPRLVRGFSWEDSPDYIKEEAKGEATLQGSIMDVGADDGEIGYWDKIGGLGLFAVSETLVTARDAAFWVGFLDDTEFRENVEENLRKLRIPVMDPFTPAKETVFADAILSLQLPLDTFEEWVTKKDILQDGNFIEPVKKLLQAVVNKSPSLMSHITSFWENDATVVQKFKEKFGSGTYVGYKENVLVDRGGRAGPWGSAENLADTPLNISDDNFFIFGDVDLIQDYLYGDILNKAIYTPESRSILSQVARGVPAVGEIAPRGANYFLDPFWNRIYKDMAMNLIVQAPIKDLKERKSTPATRSKLRSKMRGTYFAQIQEIVNRGSLKPTPLGFFNDYDVAMQAYIPSIPDEFGILVKDENKAALDSLFELGVPFFLGNTKNSNVMSYTFDADNFIFTQFFGTIQEIYYNMTYRYVKLGAQNKDIKGVMSSDQVFEQIYGVLDRIRKSGGAAGSYYSDAFKGSPQLDLTKLSTDLADIFLMESDGIKRKVSKNFGSGVISMCMLFRSLFQSQFKGHVKSLPMFNISRYSDITKPAVVMLKGTPSLNGGSTLNRSTTDFFSGMYRILGFKHSIKSNKAHSEFTVVKDIASTLNHDK